VVSILRQDHPVGHRPPARSPGGSPALAGVWWAPDRRVSGACPVRCGRLLGAGPGIGQAVAPAAVWPAAGGRLLGAGPGIDQGPARGLRGKLLGLLPLLVVQTTRITRASRPHRNRW